VDNQAPNVETSRSCVETAKTPRNHHMLRSGTNSNHNILCQKLDSQPLEA